MPFRRGIWAFSRTSPSPRSGGPGGHTPRCIFGPQMKIDYRRTDDECRQDLSAAESYHIEDCRIHHSQRRLKGTLHHKSAQKLHLEEWEACRLEFISARLTELAGSLVGAFQDDLEARRMAMESDGARAFQSLETYDRGLAEFIEAVHAQDINTAYAAGQLARLFIWGRIRVLAPRAFSQILWGRMVSCSGLAIRLACGAESSRPIANRPQINQSAPQQL